MAGGLVGVCSVSCSGIEEGKTAGAMLIQILFDCGGCWHDGGFGGSFAPASRVRRSSEFPQKLSDCAANNERVGEVALRMKMGLI